MKKYSRFSRTNFPKPTLSPLAASVRLAIVSLSLAHGSSQAATVMVDSLMDDGDGNSCTLREAIDSINQTSAEVGCIAEGDFGVDDQVVFASTITLTDQINLQNSALSINKSMRINGPESDWTNDEFPLFIRAAENNRVFDIFQGGSPTPPQVSINNLTIGLGSTSGYGAGLLVNQGSSLNLVNSVVVDNESTAGGGGLDVRNSSAATVDRVRFEGNQGTSGGAASVLDQSEITLRNSILNDNSATLNGGGIAVNDRSFLELFSTSVTKNTATSKGGGIHSYESDLSIGNSTISTNTAGTIAGGIYIYQSGTASLTNLTISGNTASSIGGVTLKYADGFTLANSIVAGNRASSSAEIEDIFSNSTITATNNLLGDFSHPAAANALLYFPYGGSNITATADGTMPTKLSSILGQLANNGGPSLTHTLRLGSPAIDNADNNLCTSAPINSEDQRAQPRPTGAACDIGAVEMGLPGTIVVNTAADSTGTAACSLRDAITSSNSGEVVGGCAAGSEFNYIEFDASIFPDSGIHTISLNSELPEITREVSIKGRGRSPLVIDASAVDSGLEVRKSSLTLNLVAINGSNRVGIESRDGILDLSNCIVSSNKQTGIDSEYSIISLKKCTITGNNASTIGAGIGASESTIYLDQSTVSGNTAGQSDPLAGYARGGGMDLINSTLSLINSTVSENFAQTQGGGINSRNSAVNIINSTLSGNTAGVDGGGLASQADTIDVRNTIIAGNFGSGYTEIKFAPFEANFSAENSLLGEASKTNVEAFGVDYISILSGPNNISATNDGTDATELSSILSPLTNNGGRTQTHNLVANSPAIDAGDSQRCAAVPVGNLDQRGRQRPVGRNCDIGAVEFEQGSFFVVPLPNGRVITFEL